ncbi:MAG: nitroreductase family protein, partial [Vallitaleaceae bacterium]|nr:nitroreductase family protein [Vallitaleaceae bacterium]
MEIFECIQKRRSIRKYKEQEVERDKIDQIIKAAMMAPSACNMQPWEFVIITEKSVLSELKEGIQFGRYNAPVAIMVYIGYADEEKGERTSYNEKRVYWEKYDS